MSEEDKRKLSKEEKRADVAWESVVYSVQRIDLMIIGISGAGIYTVFEILKFIYQEHLCSCQSVYFKWSGVFFALAIILNFIGQWLSYNANMEEHNDAISESIKIESGNNSIQDSTAPQKINKAAKIDSINKLVGYISTACMFIGLFLIMLFTFLFL